MQDPLGADPKEGEELNLVLTSKVDPRTERVKDLHNGRRAITYVFK